MGEDGIPDGDQGSFGQHTRRRLTVAQAADAMGVTVDAIRARIKRETIEHVREGGRVYVILVTDQGATKRVQDHAQGSDQQLSDEGVDYRDELVEELRGQVDYLQGIIGTRDRELSEMRRLLAGALERIPEIEAPRDSPPEPRDAPETASEGEYGTETPAGDTGEPRRASWWRRFFGFEDRGAG